jgi:hypothetical protein
MSQSVKRGDGDDRACAKSFSSADYADYADCGSLHLRNLRNLRIVYAVNQDFAMALMAMSD